MSDSNEQLEKIDKAEKRGFMTGATRSPDPGKPRPDYISPYVLLKLERMIGCNKVKATPLDAINNMAGYKLNNDDMHPILALYDIGLLIIQDKGNVAAPSVNLVIGTLLQEIGAILRDGSIKHGAWNWALGMPMQDCYASFLRHMSQYMVGDRDENHLAHAACNVMFMVHFDCAIRHNTTLANVTMMPASYRDDFFNFKKYEITY